MEPFVPVADELLLQGAAVVLEVPQDEDTADVLGRDDVDAVIGRTGQDRQGRMAFDSGVVDVRMARLGDEVTVVEAPQQGMVFHGQVILVDAGKLFRQEMFLDPVMVIQSGLGAPAIIKDGKDVALGPFHVFREFLPVVDVFEVIAFDGRSRDEEAVIVAVFDVLEFQVGRVQVGVVRVGRFVRDRAAEIDFDLDGGISQKAQQHELRRFFQGHQVQNQDAQGADVLRMGPLFRDCDDSFLPQIVYGGQLVVDFDWHTFIPPVQVVFPAPVFGK